MCVLKLSAAPTGLGQLYARVVGKKPPQVVHGMGVEIKSPKPVFCASCMYCGHGAFHAGNPSAGRGPSVPVCHAYTLPSSDATARPMPATPCALIGNSNAAGVEP